MSLMAYGEHTVEERDGQWSVREHRRRGLRTSEYATRDLAKMEVERCRRFAMCPVSRRLRQELLRRRAEPRMVARPGRLRQVL